MQGRIITITDNHLNMEEESKRGRPFYSEPLSSPYAAIALMLQENLLGVTVSILQAGFSSLYGKTLIESVDVHTPM